MKKQTTKIGKIAFILLVPSTALEFNQLASGGTHDDEGNISVGQGTVDENAVLEGAINYAVAHVILGKTRTAYAKELISRGAERKVLSKDENGKERLEKTDAKWIDRAVKALGLTEAEQTSILQGIADKVGFDLSGSRQTKDYTSGDLKDAKAILEAIQLGQSSFERVKSALQRKNPNLDAAFDTEDGAGFTAETLARYVKVDRQRAETEKLNALLG